MVTTLDVLFWGSAKLFYSWPFPIMDVFSTVLVTSATRGVLGVQLSFLLGPFASARVMAAG